MSDAGESLRPVQRSATTTVLARLADHPSVKLGPPPTAKDIPDPVARRAALLKRRRQIEAMLYTPDGDEDTHFHWSITWLTKAAVLGLRCVGLWERGYRNRKLLHLREVEWVHPNLPKELDGLTLLHLADFHYRRKDFEFADAVVELLDEVEVDICLMTGDYRYGHAGPSDHVGDFISRFLSRLKVAHGTYAIMGNHDTHEVISTLPNIGVKILINEGVSLNINGVPVWIAGTDDSFMMQCSDIQAACHGRGEGDFTIAMLHTPDEIAQAQAAGVHVYLCGHTHGGQIRLPFIGALVSNAHCAREYTYGPWRVGNLFGLTSPGLGTTDLPVRYNCPAEAHLITLRCAG